MGIARRRFRVAGVAALALALLLGVVSVGWAASVAILPFEVNAQDRLDYLREGLSDMLASRLGGSDGVETVARERVAAALPAGGGRLSDDKARAVGAKLGASHVLYGSLTVIGNSLSLDARLVEVKGGTRAFFAEGQGIDSLIPKVGEISAQAAAALTGRPAPLAAAPRPAPVAPAAPAAPAGVPTATASLVAATATPAAPIVAAPAQTPGDAFVKLNDETGAWRSRPLSFDVRGMALADVDGDGRNEIVFLDDHIVYVYRYDKQNLVELERWEAPKAADCLTVDAADLNGNGRAEIYVTALRNKKLASFVLELTGTKLVKLVDGIDYFLRVVDYPGQGKVLVGQRMDRDAPYRPGICRLSWQGKTLQPGEVYTEEVRFTVYNWQPVAQESGVGCLSIQSDDLLHLYAAGAEEWRSQDYYAGSRLYFDLFSRKVSNDEPQREYLPQRVLSIDGGRLIAGVANKGFISRWLKTYKDYAGGEVRLLTWNPQGLNEAWASRPIDGYIADIAAGDLDGDGALELLAAVSMKSSWNPIQRTKSGLVVYRLPAQVPHS